MYPSDWSNSGRGPRRLVESLAAWRWRVRDACTGQEVDDFRDVAKTVIDTRRVGCCCALFDGNNVCRGELRPVEGGKRSRGRRVPLLVTSTIFM